MTNETGDQLAERGLDKPRPVKPLDALEEFVAELSGKEIVGDLKIELHRLLIAFQAPLRAEIDEWRTHANNLGDALAKCEEERESHD
jgi:hypothetical protein